MSVQRTERGFTLLEIMLVLVLLSLGAVTVVMNLPAAQQEQAHDEAKRFYHRLQLLNEDAILNGRDYGIRFEEGKGHYHFLQLKAEGWQKFESRHFTEQTVPDDLELSYHLGSSAWSDNESLFNKESLFDEEMFAEFDDEEQVKPPQIFVLSSGEVTPFTFQLTPKDKSQSKHFWRVRAEENGVIRLLAAGEGEEQ